LEEKNFIPKTEREKLLSSDMNRKEKKKAKPGSKEKKRSQKKVQIPGREKIYGTYSVAVSKGRVKRT